MIKIAIAVMSIQSGMLFNARGVFLLNPSIRMVGNFFASITPIIMTFYLVRYFDKSIIKKNTSIPKIVNTVNKSVFPKL